MVAQPSHATTKKKPGSRSPLPEKIAHNDCHCGQMVIFIYGSLSNSRYKELMQKLVLTNSQLN